MSQVIQDFGTFTDGVPLSPPGQAKGGTIDVWAGNSPVVKQPKKKVVAGSASLAGAFTSNAPTLSASITLTASAVELAFTGAVPAVVFIRTADAGVLAFTGAAPDVVLPIIEASAGVLDFVGAVPSCAPTVTLTASAAASDFSVTSPSLTVGSVTLTADATALATEAQLPQRTATVTLESLSSNLLSFSSDDPQADLTAEPGAVLVEFTSNEPAITLSITLAAESAELTVAGVNPIGRWYYAADSDYVTWLDRIPVTLGNAMTTQATSTTTRTLLTVARTLRPRKTTSPLVIRSTTGELIAE